ncbi:LacI family DNA-binding transcriptional regulator [Amphibacillus cookii]|uniref:LacI family DNA-binding transcriptional regulator n=1 Tax=Amphibacillus cookii TaxID=767787 RepID=UPI00195BFC42|nr:LacI family DNA-binding transcriptional regulator [Amphibacillus cookii]MBM7542030.1 DNA-binding LacI/PurR family transcriptional regulator [Amphibacillus cookii]
MVTIIDIAKLSKTSKSTVSRVISGNGYVSLETREKVLKAVKELGYVPNHIARQLKYQRTNTIGFLVNDYYPSVGDFIHYFVKIAEKYDYRVNVYFKKTEQEELEILNLMMMRLLDGVFLLEKRSSWKKILPYAEFGPISTWRRIDSKKIYSSYIDHYPIYLQILEYIYSKNTHKVGHIFNDKNNSNTQARLKAIKTFEKNHNTDNYWKIFYSFQINAGVDAAEKWISLGDKAPKTIVIYSDYVATEFISTIKKNGFKVPEDCEVIGFDNSNFGQLMNITTVDTYLEKQAKNAFHYIYNELNIVKLDYEEIEPKLIIRETC